MKYQNSHLSDQQLLLDVEGELSARDAKLVQAHMDTCWKCRARCQEIESTIINFVRAYQGEMDAQLPPVSGPRSLLRAQLAQLAQATPSNGWLALAQRLHWKSAAIAIGLVVLGLFGIGMVGRQSRAFREPVILAIPDSRLTPGATLLVNRQAVCQQANTKNKEVSIAVRRKVFEEYGIRNAAPQAYEVDYLVTPALGGADDIRNLWPHSYSATVWNARVKDALEDRLREMVCGGSLDLIEAQREIAGNWIAAYKKYFHTDRPIDGWRQRTP